MSDEHYEKAKCEVVAVLDRVAILTGDIKIDMSYHQARELATLLDEAAYSCEQHYEPKPKSRRTRK